jgi:hypothetical protein
VLVRKIDAMAESAKGGSILAASRGGGRGIGAAVRVSVKQ